ARELARAVEERRVAAKAEAVALQSVVGGGSLPGAALRSWGVAVTHSELGPQEVAGRLRRRPVPVVARVDDDRVLLDLRTVRVEQDREVEAALLDVLS
ncbi:MAG TPA: hypothetical protein VHI71_11935, partial [Actinomycetota bacterium]|nr:hypothetical protein [Actinomycetota bacterium]